MRQFFNLLGLARRAGCLSLGHDAAKSAVRGKRAKLCFLADGAAPRLCAEFAALCAREGVPLCAIPVSVADMRQAVGVPAAVLTVNESGFAKRLQERQQDVFQIN